MQTFSVVNDDNKLHLLCSFASIVHTSVRLEHDTRLVTDSNGNTDNASSVVEAKKVVNNNGHENEVAVMTLLRRWFVSSRSLFHSSSTFLLHVLDLIRSTCSFLALHNNNLLYRLGMD